MTARHETGEPAWTVAARAPVRVDLAGGTLDLWPLGLLHPGSCTVAVAVSLRVEAFAAPSPRRGLHRLRALDLDLAQDLPVGGGTGAVGPLALLARLADVAVGERARRGVLLATRSPVRAGSGLGTSSALGVAALAALDALAGRRRRRRDLVAVVRDVEAALLGIPAGEQDHWAAVMGGTLRLGHEPGGPRVERVPVDARALGRRLLLVDSGEGRSSAPSNWDMFRRRVDGEREAVDGFARIAEAGRAAWRALEARDWPALGRAMRADTDARRHLSPLVVTPTLDAIFEAAGDAGALGGRVCGAGGGGFAVVLCDGDPGRRRVAAAIREAGGAIVDAQPVRGGLRVRRR